MDPGAQARGTVTVMYTCSGCGISFDKKRGFDVHRTHRFASPMCRGGFEGADSLLSGSVWQRHHAISECVDDMPVSTCRENLKLVSYSVLHVLPTITEHYTYYMSLLLLHGIHTITTHYTYYMTLLSLHVLHNITRYYIHYIQLQYITCITGYYCHYMILQVLHHITCITLNYNVLQVLHDITAITSYYRHYNVLHKLQTITSY